MPFSNSPKSNNLIGTMSHLLNKTALQMQHVLLGPAKDNPLREPYSLMQSEHGYSIDFPAKTSREAYSVTWTPSSNSR